MYCDKCGFKLEDTDKFCTACGNKVDNSVLGIVTCNVCKSQLHQGDSFCEKCGAKVSVGYSVLANKKPNYKKIKWAITCVSVVVISIIVIACMYANSPGQKILGRWSDQYSDPKVFEFKSNGTVYNREDLFTSKTYTYKVKGNNTLYMYYKDNKIAGVYNYSSSAKNDNTSYFSDYEYTEYDTGYWYIENDILYLDGRTYYRQ